MRDAIFVRKRFTPAQRAKTLADYRVSGLTQHEFAARAGISLGSLSNWLRQKRSQPPRQNQVSFLEIPPLVAASATGYKVRFADGMVLEVPRGFTGTEVRDMLRLIREL